MKRTEKIEVRVSQEEKTTLTQLAKQEGESISGLVRGLIDKYMSLNATTTKRRLPKWQLGALLLFAAFLGHAFTLIPQHLHDQNHAEMKSQPIYYVHGVIGESAFGLTINDQMTKTKTLSLRQSDENPVHITLTLSDDIEGQDKEKLTLLICESAEIDKVCSPSLEQSIFISEGSPSVLGTRTQNGNAVHLFVQEMA